MKDMMKKIGFCLILGLIMLTVGCKQQTRKQIAEALGRAQMKKIEKNVNSRIQRMVVPMLKYPESYEPVHTELSIVTNDMIIYDSQTYIVLRDLRLGLDNFHETFGNDTISQEARNELMAMETLVDMVCEQIEVVLNRPTEYEAIDAFHQFYADDSPGHRARKGYHFIIHKDNRITLLGDQDEFRQVKELLQLMLEEPLSKMDPIERKIFSRISAASNEKEQISAQP